jgi:hypothetical protein
MEEHDKLDELTNEYNELMCYGLEYVFSSDKYICPYEKKELEEKYCYGKHHIDSVLFFSDALSELKAYLQEREITFTEIKVKMLYDCDPFNIIFYDHNELKLDILFFPKECHDRNYFHLFLYCYINDIIKPDNENTHRKHYIVRERECFKIWEKVIT